MSKVWLLLLAAAALVVPVVPAHASCAAPELAVSPTSAAPGDTVVVSGRYFAAECRDTGQVIASPPTTGILLVFRQADATALVEVSAGSEYTFSITVTVPATAEPGPASVTAEAPGQQPTSSMLTVVSGGAGTPDTTLPVTGEATERIALAGLACLLLGALLLAGAGRLGSVRPV